jgi:hypothetical protein
MIETIKIKELGSAVSLLYKYKGTRIHDSDYHYTGAEYKHKRAWIWL